MGCYERSDFTVVLILVELDLSFKVIGVETFVFDPKNFFLFFFLDTCL